MKDITIKYPDERDNVTLNLDYIAFTMRVSDLMRYYMNRVIIT